MPALLQLPVLIALGFLFLASASSGLATATPAKTAAKPFENERLERISVSLKAPSMCNYHDNELLHIARSIYTFPVSDTICLHSPWREYKKNPLTWISGLQLA